MEECGREFIGSIIRSMKADVVFVIGAERMYADVTQVVGKEPTIEVRQQELGHQRRFHHCRVEYANGKRGGGRC